MVPGSKEHHDAYYSLCSQHVSQARVRERERERGEKHTVCSIVNGLNCINTTCMRLFWIEPVLVVVATSQLASMQYSTTMQHFVVVFVLPRSCWRIYHFLSSTMIFQETLRAHNDSFIHEDISWDVTFNLF